MLTEEKKKLIEAEERYRHDIKIALSQAEHSTTVEIKKLASDIKSAKKTVVDKCISFFNTSLGMWFLSSILVTGGAATLQQIEHHYQDKQKNKALLISYQFEIGNRLQHMKYYLRHAKTVGDAKYALEGAFKSSAPISPEFQNLSLSALYFDLFQLIRGSIVPEERRAAMNLVLALENSEYLLRDQSDKAVLTDADKESLSKLISDIENSHLKDLKMIPD